MARKKPKIYRSKYPNTKSAPYSNKYKRRRK